MKIICTQEDKLHSYLKLRKTDNTTSFRWLMREFQTDIENDMR